MAKLSIAPGSTDKTIVVFIQDIGGSGLTGLAAADLNCRYIRVETDNDVTIAQLTLSDLSALTDAHSDGGWFPVDATNAPGWYRLDLSDAVLASGADSVGVSIIDAGANDVAQWAAEIQLSSGGGATAQEVWEYATRILTAGTNIQLPSNGLDNVTAWTVAITGNITGNLSGSVGSVTGAINTAAGTITTLDALDTAQDSQHSTTQGKVDTIDSEVEAIDTVVDAIKAKTDSLTFTVAGQADVNIQYVNDVQVDGIGTEGDPWGPV